ncbi:hypothetical protein BKG96_05115 [Rodentibacter caecimuris]|uniref:Uncharacterized protein n=1 Tax=Rodentibacter caecimuris TaxID=1796644 RepID=A0A1V3KM77_9PAST|nr:hypothetical protein [Rodentibacter heylii]OOF78695.1 hypothetical protein BKG96_05115 [Rodentibacter heylii]
MPLTSINVPQADDLNKVLAVVKCKHQHGFLSPSLLNLTKRQVDYYAHSARILGFLDRNLNLTQSGVNLATTSMPMQLMALAFRNSDVYQEWESWSLSSGETMQGHANQFLTDYFSTANIPRNQRLSNNQQGTGTISRRAKTLEDWYARLC